MTRKTLSVRITFLMAGAVGLLLTIALSVVLGYTRKVMREESQQNASEALDYTIQSIDNVLFSVEQSAGNIYWDVLAHLDDRERMLSDARKLVEVNPYVSGCEIVMRPDTTQAESPDKQPYYKQEWFTCPIETGFPCWIEPMKMMGPESSKMVVYSMPIYNKERSVIGVMRVDVSTVHLTKIVHSSKPTPKARTLLMDANGYFVVYPDSSLLLHQAEIMNRLAEADGSVKKTRDAMYAGETGYRRVLLGDGYSYVFFRPFSRTLLPGRTDQQLNWSAAIVFPEEELKGDFIRMHNIVVAIAVGCWVLLFLLCLYVTRRQLKPLRMLSNSAQRIAEGQYDEVVPYNKHHDEVGTLQKSYRKMQMSLADYMGRLQQLTTSLQERGRGLEEAYEQAKEDERMKTAVLHNMSNKMITPANAINDLVEYLSNNYRSMDEKEVAVHVRKIQRQSQTVTQLLDQLLEASKNTNTQKDE